jgi:ATP-binding cassette subfamily B multidrug efflux pump
MSRAVSGKRLAIARALVRRPDVYLFDDSFSALDVATDARLRSALRPWTADAVVLVVAQRVSTIIEADQIVVLEDGRVVGRGPHTRNSSSRARPMSRSSSPRPSREDAA